MGFAFSSVFFSEVEEVFSLLRRWIFEEDWVTFFLLPARSRWTSDD